VRRAPAHGDGDGNARPRERALAREDGVVVELEEPEVKALAHAHVKPAAQFHREAVYVGPGVEGEFRRALEINPNYATARQWYSTFLELTGRPEEAVAEAARAQELDPLSLIINDSLGARLLYAGRYERALEQMRKTLEIDPNFAQAHHTLGDTYVHLGMFEDAFGELERARQLDDNPWVVASLGYAYAVSGRGGEARRMLAELKGRSAQARVPPEEVARVYVGLGETAQAFAWLERAYEERSDHLVFVSVDPAWRDLRADPRFVDIMRRVGLAR
jgi:adenylate cyclase